MSCPCPPVPIRLSRSHGSASNQSSAFSPSRGRAVDRCFQQRPSAAVATERTIQKKAKPDSPASSAFAIVSRPSIVNQSIKRPTSAAVQQSCSKNTKTRQTKSCLFRCSPGAGGSRKGAVRLWSGIRSCSGARLQGRSRRGEKVTAAPGIANAFQTRVGRFGQARSSTVGF